jgi:ABC-type ATPase involved in cell division
MSSPTVTRHTAVRPRHGNTPPKIVPKLARVRVKGLFGKYNFADINIKDVKGSISNIAFLYGDNGVGKTTILRLIYSILSPERNNGLRGTIGRTQFVEFGVMFEDQQWVTVVKKNPLDTVYQYVFSGPRINDKIDISLDSSLRVAQSENPGMESLWVYLEAVSPTIVFLNDNRTVRSSYAPWDIRSNLKERLYSTRQVRVGERPVEVDVDAIADAGLEQLLQQSHNALRDRALLGNAAANAGTGQIYASIAKTLSKLAHNAEKTSDASFDELINRIDVAQKYLNLYGSYGLSHGDHLDTIRKYAISTPVHAKPQLVELIEPYVASIEQRIRSNKVLTEQMYAFETGINGFLNRKRMICKMDGPIRFVDEGDSILDPTSLSSGERHLVYLCCVAMLSRERQSLIIVDEPELSLNYKWQRRLMKALLEMAGPGAQFLMATHSFEIISAFRESAIDLEPEIAAS